MKFVVATIILVGLISIRSAHGQEIGESQSRIYAGLDFGIINVELTGGPDFEEGGYNKLKSFSGALSVGYQWDSGFIVEARYRTVIDFVSTFLGIDSEQHRESQYLLGYRHFINNRYSLVPMIGYSDWKIEEVSSGVFSNSGPNSVEREKGNGTVFRLGVERLLGNARSALTLYTSYSNNGENRAFDTALGVKLYF